MKQNKYIRRMGPFEVSSISQDAHGIRLVVYPAFPEYNISEKKIQEGVARNNIDSCWVEDPHWVIQRLKGNGGGPSIFTVMAMAEELEKFLNQPYSEAKVAEWKATLAKALEKITAADRRRFDKAMKRRESKNDLHSRAGSATTCRK